MQDGQRLKAFVDSVFSIDPSFADMFGTGLPGMSATAATVTDASSAGAEIINKLRAETALFAQSVTTPNPDKGAVEAQAATIEGCLRNLTVLGQLSETRCKALIEEMDALAHN